MTTAASVPPRRRESSALGERSGKDGQDVFALRDRDSGRRRASRDAGDPGDHLGRIAPAEADMEVHVGAVEERVAFREDSDRQPGVKAGGDTCRRGVEEPVDRLAIGGIGLRDLGGHGIEERQFGDARPQMGFDDPAGIAGVPGLGEIGDHFGFADRLDRLSGSGVPDRPARRRRRSACRRRSSPCRRSPAR